MGFKLYEVGCPCCSGCQVTFQAKTCNDAYYNWGNLYPPDIMPPTGSISVRLGKCSHYSYLPGNPCPTCDSYTLINNDIFYPLSDPSKSGIHTFNYGKGSADLLIIEYDTNYFGSVGDGVSVIQLQDNDCNISCQSSIVKTMPTLIGYVILDPCWSSNLENGAVWHVNYNRPYSKLLLDLYSEVLPYEADYWLSNQCSLIYCVPSGGYPYTTFKGPYQGPYYKVFVNRESVNFKINNQYPSPESFNYISDMQLLYAYVTYYPSGQPFPCDNRLAFLPCYRQTNTAIATYLYVYTYAASRYQGILTCGPTCSVILSTNLPDIQPPYGQYCGFNNPLFPTLPCEYNSYGWCGEDAFNQAESFVQNLPMTVQPGEYGTTTGLDYAIPFESFPNNISDPSGMVISCPEILCRNFYYGEDCNGNVIFSGYHTVDFKLG